MDITRRKLLATVMAMPAVATLPQPAWSRGVPSASPYYHLKPGWKICWVEEEFDANIGMNVLALKSNFEGGIPVEMAHRAMSKYFAGEDSETLKCEVSDADGADGADAVLRGSTFQWEIVDDDV